jgi:hypothetical protein
MNYKDKPNPGIKKPGRPRKHDSGVRVQIRPTVHPFIAKCLERQDRPAGEIIDELVSEKYNLELK